MELSSSDKERIQHQYDALAKKTLVGEAKSHRRTLAKRAAREVTFPVMGYLSFRKSISAVDVLLQADKAYCSLTKKAAFGAQHNRQTGTFRLYRASRRVRHDSFSP